MYIICNIQHQTLAVCRQSGLYRILHCTPASSKSLNPPLPRITLSDTHIGINRWGCLYSDRSLLIALLITEGRKLKLVIIIYTIWATWGPSGHDSHDINMLLLGYDLVWVCINVLIQDGSQFYHCFGLVEIYHYYWWCLCYYCVLGW